MSTHARTRDRAAAGTLDGAVTGADTAKASPLAQRGRNYVPTPKVIQMSPALAEKILDRNTLNRSLRKGRVEKYARDMKAGDWLQNGETIKITDDGQLLDGQHRLFAVIEAGVTVPMLVVEGLDKDVMPTIDTGAPRGFRDVLTIGGGKNTSLLSSAARWLHWYNLKPRPATTASIQPTHTELLATLEGNPDLVDAASAVASTKNARALVTPSALVVVYLLAARVDAGKAGAWLAMIDKGEGLDGKHPVLQLRERMMSNRLTVAKLPAMDVLALTIKSWNQYLTGKRTVNLRWSSQEEFPEIATTSGRGGSR